MLKKADFDSLKNFLTSAGSKAHSLISTGNLADLASFAQDLQGVGVAYFTATESIIPADIEEFPKKGFFAQAEWALQHAGALIKLFGGDPYAQARELAKSVAAKWGLQI